MDFLYANLDKPTIPEDLDLLDEGNLKNLEEKSVLSINGMNPPIFFLFTA